MEEKTLAVLAPRGHPFGKVFLHNQGGLRLRKLLERVRRPVAKDPCQPPTTCLSSTMKTSSPILKVALLTLGAATLAPLVSHAEDDKNENTNRRHKEGRLEREANRERGLNETYNELVNNPTGLFHKLDTDGNGQLSEDEFGRAVNMSSQGQMSTGGTQGVKGAAGATAGKGGTGVAGQAMPAPAAGQAGAQYGQQPNNAGSPSPAGQQQPANTATQDAAASGQQQTPAPQSPGTANTQPAPGQEPTAQGTTTAPTTKEGQEPAPQQGQAK